MKRTAVLAVFAMTLLILAGDARAQTASGEPSLVVNLELPAGAGHAQAASGKHGPMAKVGSALARLHAEHQAHVAQQGSAKGFKPSNPLLPVRDNWVVIDAVASGSTSTLEADLKGWGLQKASSFGRMVSGRLPVDAIKGMAGLGSLKFARPAYAMTRAGLATSQGDLAMRSDIARSTFALDGTGVTVGTLSDSFDCLGGAATDVVNGDLPPGYVVLEEELGCGSGTDEGRAMMQLIHDVAPGASQAFHTAFNGQAGFALGIEELAGCPTGSSAGCIPAGVAAHVIADDVIYFAEPMFQDGIIAQAADRVVASGVAYFSAAGNENRDAYESPFRGSGTFLTVGGVPSGELHDFNPGPGVDFAQRIDVPAGSGFILSFQWDESYLSAGGPGSTSDMDVYVTDRRNRFILASSTTNNLGGDPVEVLQFINFGFGNRFNILIANFGGPAPGLMKYVKFDLGPGVVVREFDTARGTIYGHANADGAEAVGAAFYGDTPEFGTTPPLLEAFSSAGPTPILFETNGTRKVTPEVRQKPEIVAPDGTDTTFFGGSDIEPNGFPNFFGTSAAAPHAAAVAALQLQADPSLSPGAIYAALEGTAFDMGDPGVDDESGFGLIQADLAVEAVSGPDTTAPAVTINQAAGQADPTNASPINFIVVFSEDVMGFTGGDVLLNGTAVGPSTTATVSGGPATYNVAVSGMADGTVIASIPADAAIDTAGNGNLASTNTDSTVTFDTTAPTVTINQAAGQADPTNASPINFTVVFSEDVMGFTGGDVLLNGTADATTAMVTGGPATYNVAVSGMTSSGTVTASIGAGVATDAAGNGNLASTSTDDTVTFNAPAGPTTMHVHDLDAISEKLQKGSWQATVTITVRDELEGAVDGATVVGSFSQNGTVIPGDCTTTTGSNGTCSIGSGQFPSKSGQASFTVENVTVTDSLPTYGGWANHDPDGDSDGTTINLSK